VAKKNTKNLQCTFSGQIAKDSLADALSHVMHCPKQLLHDIKSTRHNGNDDDKGSPTIDGHRIERKHKGAQIVESRSSLYKPGQVARNSDDALHTLFGIELCNCQGKQLTAA